MHRTPAGETRGKVHDFVSRRILRGSPPSVREVQEAFGFRSTATARQHLDALVEAGALERDPGRDRGYRLPGACESGMAPVLGRVQAGNLTEAIELAEGYVPVDAKRAESSFALVVVGESMAGREIHDGDIVLVQRGASVKPGDVVVALVGDEATIKTFTKVGRRIVLRAENPDYADIVPTPDGPEFRILGRVYEIRRQL
ncbi:MAG: transcriptional repressor LexA [Gammaproteobacteria bacterium]